jgi:hypothetical protein
LHTGWQCGGVEFADRHVHGRWGVASVPFVLLADVHQHGGTRRDQLARLVEGDGLGSDLVG